MTAQILRWTAEQMKKGETPFWKYFAKAWEKRQFVAWSEAWSLYITALHFEALNDADCPLVPFFPSCGGTAEADPSPALARFFSAPPKTFYENLRDRQRRPYSQARSYLWVSPAMLFFQRKRGLPFYLVEANSGAGLNLAADVVNTAAAKNSFDSSLVAARVGLDPQPLDVSDLVQRRWLTACVFPDDLASIGELDAAIDAVQGRAKDDASFIQLASCTPDKAAAFISKNVPSDDPDVGLLIFNMGATVRMTDPDYAAYSASIAGILKDWGDRGLWVEVESVRGETYSTTLQVRAHRLVSGSLRSLLMASFDLQASKHVYSQASAAFLDVK